VIVAKASHEVLSNLLAPCFLTNIVAVDTVGDIA